MWHLIWTHYAAAVIGFIAGFFVCAMCCASRQAEDDAEEIMRREQDELIERSLDYDEEA